MDRILIKGGRVIDPASSTDETLDIVIMGGRVASIKKEAASDIESGGEGWTIIDALGKLVVPGLIDIHVHLREPGEEYKETIETGTRAAARGGVTTVVCMANTSPVNDNESVTRFILRKAEEAGLARVYPVGAVTVGLKGEKLSEMGELTDAGCVAFSDDGVPVSDSGLMRSALEYSASVGGGKAVITHAEDCSLAEGGVMNESAVSTKLGLKGIPNEVEDILVARDIALAELTGGHLHVAHVSTRGAVELIRAAKARGVRVTAEATPHHLTLDDSALSTYDTSAKMSPPLRSEEDVLSLRAALKDGTIDCVATDHAPHSSIEKDIEFDRAANGVVGLETSLALILKLVDEGVLTLGEAIERMTINPARVMGLDIDKFGLGSIKVGAPADITIIDTGLKWTVDPSDFASKGRNTPFAGMELKGRAVMTILEGKVVFDIEKD